MRRRMKPIICADGDGIFVDIEHRRVRARSSTSRKTRTRSTVSAAISGLSAFVVAEFLAHLGIAPGGVFDLLLLRQHLRGVLEALVLEQPLDELAARVFRSRLRQPRRACAAAASCS
jgi:hypothetical protein